MGRATILPRSGSRPLPVLERVSPERRATIPRRGRGRPEPTVAGTVGLLLLSPNLVDLVTDSCPSHDIISRAPRKPERMLASDLRAWTGRSPPEPFSAPDRGEAFPG